MILEIVQREQYAGFACKQEGSVGFSQRSCLSPVNENVANKGIKEGGGLAKRKGCNPNKRCSA